MKYPRHLIEVRVRPKSRDLPEGEVAEPLLPQIRRPMERLCKKLGVEFAYEDLVEMHIFYGYVTLIYYLRNEAGELYRDEQGKVATALKRIDVDTFTFVGDEKDI
jgi:hypothetical protein